VIAEIVSAFRRSERRGLEQSFVDNPREWMVRMFGGGPTASGAVVTETSAMSAPAFFRSVVAPSETLASLPHLTYQRRTGGGKDRATEHPLYERLHLAPNPEMTAMLWGEMGQMLQYLWGDQYSEIVRNGRGAVNALWPIHSARVAPKRLDSGEKVYVVTLPGNGEPRVLRRDQMLHISGPSLDGFKGMERLKLHAESIGLDLALRTFGARFFANNALGGGWITHPGKLQDPARQNLRDSIEKMSTGLTNAHRFALLEEGLTFHEGMVKPEQGQMLESRQHQDGDHARSIGVPGIVIGHDDKTATYASAEQFFLAYKVHTLTPLAVRRDQACTMQLLTERERRAGLFVETLLDGLLRGDSRARAEASEIEFRNGIISPDDWNERENRNPLPNGIGAKHYIMANMIPMEMAGQMPAKDQNPAGGGGNGGGNPTNPRALAPSDAVFARDAAARLVRKEMARVRERATKYAGDSEGFRAAVTEFYSEHVGEIARDMHVEPGIANAYAERHRDALIRDGIGVMEAWERDATGALTALALGGGS
jgi:HK97 family phage portal protein